MNTICIETRDKMTRPFERLQESPQTEVDTGQLAVDERMVLKRIQINGTVGVTASESVGSFTGIYYIEGDEQTAAELFVDENLEALSQLNFSRRNPISTSVDRLVYDWILHFLGERELEKYDTVVIERRSDGTVWCLGRRTFDETPMRRYTESDTGSARIDEGGLFGLYESSAEVITESTLRAKPEVAGDVREILDAFRQSPEFACEPTTVDDELAIKKTFSK